MTDEELFQKVAEVEGWTFDATKFRKWTDFGSHEDWKRLSIEEFCFRLIKKYQLSAIRFYDAAEWGCSKIIDGVWQDYPQDKSLERAICLAVLEMNKV